MIANELGSDFTLILKELHTLKKKYKVWTKAGTSNGEKAECRLSGKL